MTIEQQFGALQDRAEQIIGNVKGGLKQPSMAASEIHQMYAELFNRVRYPGEPPVYRPEQTQADRAMQNHFDNK